MNNIIIIFFIIIFINCKIKINEVSVLLSWGSKGIELQAEGPNCFLWSTTNNNLLKLKHKDESDFCSFSILVSPIGLDREKKSALVFAKDQKTGQTLKCEVFVDNIFHIQILTTVKTLILNEMEVLQIQAMDFYENVFSSIEGLDFKWSVFDENILQLSPLNLSQVTIDPKLNRNTPESILIKASEIGKTIVKATLSLNDNGKFVDHNPSSSVEFFVVDDFSLLPGKNVYVVPKSSFNYELFHSVNGKKKKITNFRNYDWIVFSKELGKIDQKGYFTSLGPLGKTVVRVSNKDFEFNGIQGNVFVVKPKYLKIKLKQKENINIYSNLINIKKHSNDHNIVMDTLYDVEIEIYDENSYKILQTDNINLNLYIEGGGDKIEYNNRMKTLKTVKIGKISLKATASTKDGLYSLSVQTLFSIYPKVKFLTQDDTINLPLEVGVNQEFYPTNIGGSGKYSYFVTEENVIDVNSETGVITSNELGKSYFIVIDNDNYLNWDKIKVIVSLPESIQFLTNFREAAIGSDLCLNITVKNSMGNDFSNYSALNLTFLITNKDEDDIDIDMDEDFINQNKIYRYSPVNNTCVKKYNIFAFRAQYIGFTRIIVKYQSLIDSIEVATFFPLKIVSPKIVQDTSVVLSLGSSIKINFEGGPTRWRLPSYPQSKLTSKIFFEEDLKGNYFFEKKHTVAFIECLDFGIKTLRVEMKNEINSRKAKPTLIIYKKIISCQPAEYIKLTPIKSGSFIDQISNKQFSVKNNQTIEVKLDVFSPFGEIFYNYSTITNSFSLESKEDKVELVGEFGKKKDHSTIFLHLFDKIGSLFVKGFLNGYDYKLLDTKRIRVQQLPKRGKFKKLTDEVELKISSSVQFNFFCSKFLTNLKIRNVCNLAYDYFCSPSSTDVILLFPSTQVKLQGRVLGGSSKFVTSVNDTAVAHLVVIPELNQFTIQGIKEGVVEIVSKDVEFHSITKAIIKVSDVHNVLIKGSNFVELKEKSYIQIIAIDEDRNMFDPLTIGEMRYKLTFLDKNNGVINIKECGSRGGRFEIYGKKVGVVGLIATVINNKDEEISGELFEIHVFEAYSVLPSEKIIMIPGSKNHIATFGGPSLKYKIKNEFIVKNSTVATVDERGVVTGENYGKTIITLMKVVDDEVDVILKVIDVEINVVKIVETFGLNLKNLKLYKNSKVMVTLYGLSEEGFLLDPISMNSKYLKVERFENTKINNENELFFYIEKGSIGDSSVKYRVKFSHPNPLIRNAEFLNYFTVNVVDRLKINDRIIGCNNLLLPPNIEYPLMLNRENYTLRIVYNEDLIQIKNKTLTTGKKEGISGVVIDDDEMMQVVIKKPQFIDSPKNRRKIFTTFDEKLKIPILLKDNRGDIFSTNSNITIKFRMSDYDIIKVENYESKYNLKSGFVHARVIGAGITIMNIYSPQVVNPLFFEIVSKPLIFAPKLIYYIGDEIKFNPLGLKQKHELDFWKSSDPSILEIFEKTGISTCLKDGTVIISFFSKYVGETRKAIEIRSFHSIKLENDKVQFFPDKITIFKFNIIDNYGKIVNFYEKRKILNIARFQVVSSSRHVKIIETKKDNKDFIISFIASKELKTTEDLELSLKISIDELEVERLDFKLSFIKIIHSSTSLNKDGKTVYTVEKPSYSILIQIIIAVSTIVFSLLLYNAFLYKYFQ